MIKKFIKNGTSYSKVIHHLEPFMIYSDDISYKQYIDILDFIEEMKKSGYSNKEISDVLDNSLDDLFNRATSLDELDDEMM